MKKLINPGTCTKVSIIFVYRKLWYIKHDTFLKPKVETFANKIIFYFQVRPNNHIFGYDQTNVLIEHYPRGSDLSFIQELYFRNLGKSNAS